MKQSGSTAVSSEIRDGIHGNTEVIITYFKPDEKKTGGEYLLISAAE